MYCRNNLTSNLLLDETICLWVKLLSFCFGWLYCVVLMGEGYIDNAWLKYAMPIPGFYVKYNDDKNICRISFITIDFTYANCRSAFHWPVILFPFIHNPYPAAAARTLSHYFWQTFIHPGPVYLNYLYISIDIYVRTYIA